MRDCLCAGCLSFILCNKWSKVRKMHPDTLTSRLDATNAAEVFPEVRE